MRRSTILTLGCFVLLVFVVGQFLTRPTLGQAAANPVAPPGRYHMAVIEGALCVIDTTNGHCWCMGDPDTKKWTDYGSPIEQK